MNHLHHLPLADFALPLADVDTVVKVAIAIITMVLWAAGQLMGDKNKAKPPVRPRPQPPAGGPPGGAAGQPASLEESLRREVEEFMRRAQGREPAAPVNRPGMPSQPQRKAPANPAAQQRPAQQRPTQQRPAQQRPVQQPQVQKSPAKAPPRRLADSRQPAALVIEEGRGPLTGATIGQHVAEHLGGSQAMAAHAQNLGADVAQADERMESHLQERFAHKVGSLAHMEAPTATTKSTTAQDLLKLLSQPGGAKTMILANEILRRPEERWQSTTRSLRRGT